jgi:hypothetical protein
MVNAVMGNLTERLNLQLLYYLSLGSVSISVRCPAPLLSADVGFTLCDSLQVRDHNVVNK